MNRNGYRTNIHTYSQQTFWIVAYTNSISTELPVHAGVAPASLLARWFGHTLESLPHPAGSLGRSGCIAGVRAAPPPTQRLDEGVLNPPLGCCCRGADAETVARVVGCWVAHTRECCSDSGYNAVSGEVPAVLPEE